MSSNFLEVSDLKTHFPVESGLIFRKVVGTVKAVDGVTLNLEQGDGAGALGASPSGSRAEAVCESVSRKGDPS